MAVGDRLRGAQRGVEERFEIVLLAPGRDGVDKLIKIQVGKEIGLVWSAGLECALRVVKKYPREQRRHLLPRLLVVEVDAPRAVDEAELIPTGCALPGPDQSRIDMAQQGSIDCVVGNKNQRP